MNKLYERIRFDGKRYSELRDASAKEMIEDVARKLAPLEDEILAEPKGYIEILPSGITGCFVFTEQLRSKITQHLTV